MFDEQKHENENTIYENTHTPTMTAYGGSLVKTQRDRRTKPYVKQNTHEAS